MPQRPSFQPAGGPRGGMPTAPSRPSFQPPVSRPQPPVSRPQPQAPARGSDFGHDSFRPQPSQPSRPSGGFDRPTPPAFHNEPTRPSTPTPTRPFNPPSGSFDRPTPPAGRTGGFDRPNTGFDRPNQPVSRPEPTRPTTPTRPLPPSGGFDRPNPPAGRPNGGFDRPTPPAGRPNGGFDRPTPPASRPGGWDRPNSPTRPLPPAPGGVYQPRHPFGGEPTGRPNVPSYRPEPPRVRGTDSWTSRVPDARYRQSVDVLRRGGNGYYRDITYSTRITNRVNIYYNNTTYIAPSYYRRDNGLGAFASGFFAGYMAGAVDQALMDSYRNDWNSYGLYRPYAFPVAVWQPYYQQVLYRPLPVIMQPVYVDYSRPTTWATPPLDPTRDPLEQLAQFGQLQAPGGWGNTTIGAIEARNRLNQGQPIIVGGVEVFSYDQLASVVPEMARSSRVLSPSQCQVLSSTLAPAAVTPTPDQAIGNLPSFEEVYSPKQLVAEDQVNGQNVNRTMDAAAAIYDRPEVKQAIAEWWQANPSANRNALNEEINFVVTSAMQSDLATNRDRYAQTPDLEDNPVPYLQDPSNNANAVAYNTRAIDMVRNNAAQQLRANLICDSNAQ